MFDGISERDAATWAARNQYWISELQNGTKRRRLRERRKDPLILCGHGAGVFDEADVALREALSTSRRRIPGQVASAVRAWRAPRPS